MPLQTFRHDDTGYETWLTTHASGWVVNAKRAPSPAYLKLHRAQCSTISRLQAGYSRWTTGEYIKDCADRRDELEAWAQDAFGGDLQDGCHCIQDGGRTRTSGARRPPLRTPPPAASARAPALVDADGFRTIHAPAIIPFEPKDPALLEVRTELPGLLGGMTARAGELLHGVIEGPAAGGTDLDNALLYNVGGRVAGAARYGVILERRPAATDVRGARYRYRLTRDAEAGLPSGPPVVELDGIDLARQPRTWADIWAAVRTSPAVQILGTASSGELAVLLRVGAPRFAGAAGGQSVKTLVDGVLTALHVHVDSTTAPEIARRLSPHLLLSPEEICALLLGDERAALGTCQRLVVLRDRGVQCRPEDGRVAALRVEIDRDATAWTLTGRIARAAPED